MYLLFFFSLKMNKANRFYYRQHVLEDLEPFSRLDTKCLPLESGQNQSPIPVKGGPPRKALSRIAHMEFSHQTLAEWAAHVESLHKRAPYLRPAHLLVHPRPAECPFCDECCGDATTQGLYRHLGRHMNAIALVALREMATPRKRPWRASSI